MIAQPASRPLPAAFSIARLGFPNRWSSLFFRLGLLLLLLGNASFAQAQSVALGLIRHAPSVNGTVEGSLQQDLGEYVNLNSGAVITGQLLVPGTPGVRFNGTPVFGGTSAGKGSTEPSNYFVTINQGATLGGLRTRTDASALTLVGAVAGPTGNRSVTLDSPSQSAGDFGSLRDLTLNSNVGAVSVPPGTYGNFTANAGSGFTLGSPGATTPAVYNFQGLNLNSNSFVNVVGPVVVNVANGFSVNGIFNTSKIPGWLRLNIASGGVNLNSGSELYAVLHAPNGSVNVNSKLVGQLECDSLTVNQGGLLRLQSANQAPVANFQSVSVPANSSANILLTGSDADGDALSFSVAGGPLHGTLSGTAPRLVYQPAANYTGTDSFSFKANDGQADSAIVTVSISVTNTPPTVSLATPSAGAVFHVGETISLSATAQDTDGSVAKVEFFANGAKIGESSGASFGLNWSGTAVGDYALSAVAYDNLGATGTSASASISLIPANQPPTVNAGEDQTIQEPYAALLSASVTDDGVPAGATPTVTWSKVSGPGEVSFQNSASAATKANFSLEGVYVLRCTANDSLLTGSDEVTITVFPQPNQPPSVSAGLDQQVLASQSVKLSGYAKDDGLPKGSSLSLSWTKVSGPGTVSFGDAHLAQTTASFSLSGTYVLQLSANDSQYTKTAKVSVLVFPANAAPVVSVGGPQTILMSSTANLQGSIADDGMPTGSPVVVNWSVVSGPGKVTFGNASQPATTASFSAPGSYQLRLVASDTELSGTGEVTILVESEATVNHAPVVQAGPDQRIGISNAALLKGQIVDDGLPTGASLSSSWSKVSGPGEVVFGNPTSAETTATFSKPGTYVLCLVASDTALSGSDELTVTLETQNQAPRVEAGADQTITLPEEAALQGVVKDDGQPAGATVSLAWSQLSGSGTATFSAPTQAATRVAFSAPGTYVLRLTANDSLASASDEVTVTVRPQPYFSRTFTTNADFAEGQLTNVDTSVPDQIQLGEQFQMKNVIWVANSTKGTVMKINTEVKQDDPDHGVLGEYWTSPQGQPRNPSRTTVDLNGCVWVSNRDGHSLTHIVTPESGLWVDRNGNGICDTSTGLNDLRAWSNTDGKDTGGDVSTCEDECVIHYTLVHSWGTRHVSVNSDNNVWVSGCETTLGPIRLFDLLDGSTGAIIRSEPSVGYGGYGGLIDKNGVIWSANPLLRWDTAKPLTGPNGGNWIGYPQSYDGESYGLGIDPWGYIWNTALKGNIIRKYAPDGKLVDTYQHGADAAQGCVVDKNGDVWVANSSSPTVGHLKNDGTFIGNVAVGNTPTGVAVDAKGKVWVTNRYGHTVMRIDPKGGPLGADGVTLSGSVDFRSPDFGGELYNYSDMTGSTLYGKPTRGQWNVIYDSGLENAQWGKITWNASVINDGKLLVSVAISADGKTFGSDVPIASSPDFSAPAGRYLKVTVNFVRATTGESPVLYDLSVGAPEAPFEVVNHPPTVSVCGDFSVKIGEKAVVSATAADDGLPLSATRAVTWTKQSGPGEVTFADPHAFQTGVRFSEPGSYVLRANVTDGELSDSAALNATCLSLNNTPSVYAGADFSVARTGTLVVLKGWAADDGLPAAPGLKTLWSVVSGPGGVTFADATAQETNASFATPGIYILQLLADDGGLKTSRDLTVKANPQPVAPAVSAGSDQEITLPSAAVLNGSAATPSGEWVASCWTQIDGPGTVTFDNPFSPITGAHFSGPGLYQLKLTGSGSPSAISTVSIKLNPAVPDVVIVPAANNLPPMVSVGDDQTIKLPAGAALSGSASDDGLPAGSSLAFLWQCVVGPGAVCFDDPAALSTTAHFAAPGVYRLKLVASDGALATARYLTVTVQPSTAANAAPLVNAGTVLPVPIASGASLHGSVFDDGLPLGRPVSLQWSVVSGPGTVTFGAPQSADSHADFSLPGSYLLRLTANDSELSGTGDVVVRVYAETNSAPVVNAGPSASISISAPATLAGSVSDDGLPLSGTLAVGWRKVSGPGNVSFVRADSPTTTASFSEMGTYVLELSADDSEKRAASTVTITVGHPANTAPVVDAGADQSVPYGAFATVAPSIGDDYLPNGTLSVQWAQVGGPAPVMVQNGEGDNLLVTGPKLGSYTLRLTVGDGEFSVSDDVTVTVTSGTLKAPTVQMTSPAANSSSPDGAWLTVAAAASSPNGLIETVEFYADGAKIGERSGAADGAGGNYALTWVAPAAGDHALYAVATDTLAVSATSATLHFTSFEAPLSVVLASPTESQKVLSGRAVPIAATTTGKGVSSVTFFAEGAQIGASSSAPYCFSWSNAAVGTHSISATVATTSGSIASSEPVSIEVVDGSNASAPVLKLTSPDEAATLTAPTAFKGTASSPILKSWKLSYRERATASNLQASSLSANQGWVQFAGGTSSVNNDTLGTLDTTQLRNGLYDIELVLTDLGGTSYALDASVVVDGGMKVGAFTLAFNDLQVPLSGLPITVTRTYDSRARAASGDFGFGWSLDVNSVHLDKNQPLGDSWYADVQPPPDGNPFVVPVYSIYDTSAHVITVSFPDGKTCRFNPVLKFNGKPLEQFYKPYGTGDAFTMEFEPQPGTQGKLVARDLPSALYMQEGTFGCPLTLSTISGDYGLDHGFSDATGFDYVSPEGRVFSFDSEGKLVGTRDRNGNALSYERDALGVLNAITYSNPNDPSASRSIAFERDGSNRITRIVDPSGRALNYQYDAAGDLVAFFDRSKDPKTGPATATFTYPAGSHYLTKIADASGVAAIRNEYDAQNRLVKSTDAAGKTIVYTHNVDGRTETITDRSGNTTVHVYDDRGNVLSTTDALGHKTSTTYDERNNKLSETNALGQTTTYAYDAYDRLLSVTDALGHSTAFTYNNLSLPLTIADALGHVTTNAYDSAGNLLSTTDAKGNTTSFTYDAKGNRTSTTDALGNVSTSAFNSLGQVTSTTDALGHSTTYTYDANGNQLTQATTRSASAAGGTGSSGTLALVTTRVYDEQDRLVKTIDPDGSFTETIYNELGQQSASNDKLDRQTQMDYDARGNLVKTTHPDGTFQQTGYDAEGRRATSTDRAGNVTSYSYDDAGRLAKTTFADGTFSETAYDAAGRVASSTDATGTVTSYGYDAGGRRVNVTDALGNTSAYSYDPNGNQVAFTDALNRTTTYLYDELNRRVATVYPDSTQSSTTYDALGRRLSETDQNGNTKAFGYDALGRLTSVTDAMGYATSYTYDELGNQLTQTDANNHTTSYAYDDLGRRISRALPMGMTETCAYDAAGNLVSRTDFNGKVTQFAYDAMNRLLKRTPDASFGSEPPVSFTYTATGQRATMSDASGVTTYSYDARERLVEKATPQGTLAYGYDANGSLTGMASNHANGASVSYDYDALHRLAKVTDTHLGATAYAYDAVGNLAGFATPNGVTHAYTYNALNRLTNLSVTRTTGAGGYGPGNQGATSTLASYAYTLAPGGQRLSVTEADGRRAVYAYDALSRLTRETITGDTNGHNGSIGYTLDKVGNRLARASTVAGIASQGFAYDANDRLCTDQCDANGNTLLSANLPATALQGTDTYDSQNRLVARGNSASGNIGSSVTLVYDGDGNKVRETVNGVTTTYLVDDRNPTGYAQVIEELVNGAVTRSYTFGHALLSQDQLDSSGTAWKANFYGFDGHGNVRLLTDETGTVTDRYDYDAFGALLAKAGNTFNRYQFCGEQFDDGLGLYNLRARLMNPGTGRFWSMDGYEGTHRDPQSLHKYLYCSGNPVNGRDPSGNYLEEKGIAVGVEASWLTQATLNTARTYMTVSRLSGLTIATLAVGTAAAIATWVDYLGNPAGIRVPNQNQLAKDYNVEGFGVFGKCVDYAQNLANKINRFDLTFIAYRLRLPRTVHSPWGYISPQFGVFSPGWVATNGFHVGVVWKGKVYDNNIWGLSIEDWMLNYEVFKEPNMSTVYNLAEADADGFGQIKIFKNYPPTGREDSRWDMGGLMFF
jgi:RHS repeat-associated protein